MSKKRAKQQGRKRRERERFLLEHKCRRCGNALPAGQELCQSCAELWGAEREAAFHDDDPIGEHTDFRARPGVTNDQLRDGFPRP